MPPGCLPWMAIVAAQAIFAIWNVICKHTLARQEDGTAALDKLSFAFIRCTTASLLMLAANALRTDFCYPAKADTPILVAQGLLLVGVQVCFLYGVDFSDATTAGVWQTSAPVWTALLDIVFRCTGERLSRNIIVLRLISVPLAVAGSTAVLLLGPEDVPLPTPLASRGNPGNGTLSSSANQYLAGTRVFGNKGMLGSAFLCCELLCLAGLMLLQKQSLSRYPAHQVVLWNFMVTLVPLGCWSAFRGTTLSTARYLQSNRDAELMFVFVVILATLGTYRLMGWANSRLSPTILALGPCMQPPLTALVALMVDGTQITFGQLLGTLLTVFAVAIVAGTQPGQGSKALSPGRTRRASPGHSDGAKV